MVDVTVVGEAPRPVLRSGAELFLPLEGLIDPEAERARVTRIGGVVLAGKHENLDARRMGKQVRDELKAFIGPMRSRRQAEIHQRQVRRLVHLTQQTDGVRA